MIAPHHRLDFSVPPDAAPAPIQICLLGSFRLLKAGQPMSLRGGSKIEVLLAYLGLRSDECIARALLTELLWPDSDLPRAEHSFRSLLHSLQRQLGDVLGGAPLIVHSDGCYQLNRAAGVDTDIARFDALVQRGDQQAQLDYPAAAATYHQAIALYRGDLHVGEADVQAVLTREHLRSHFLALLLRLATLHFDHQQYLEAIELLRRLLYLDPCFEHAHRLLMRCYARLGQRSVAVHHYGLCRDILRSELDTTPDPETHALVDQIRREPHSV